MTTTEFATIVVTQTAYLVGATSGKLEPLQHRISLTLVGFARIVQDHV